MTPDSAMPYCFSDPGAILGEFKTRVNIFGVNLRESIDIFIL
jgi:hypothetical protein